MTFDPKAFLTNVPMNPFIPLVLKQRAESDISAWVSDAPRDHGWDEFLGSSPLGQFQQSSLWAEGKCDERWRVLRVVLTRCGLGIGGFQIICRRSKLGLIGYISKGPVLCNEQDETWQACLSVIDGLVRQRRFRALILQPPDRSTVSSGLLTRKGWVAEKTMEVIDASLWFDLAGTPDTLLARMPGYNRTFVRQAIRKGVTVREGGEADIPQFFDLMQRTCLRQGVAPNPATEMDVMRIWRAFSHGNRMRIVFAEREGKTLAALAAFVFGDRITLWKKGWTSESADLRPNHLLYYDALCWGQRLGASFCDFYSVRRDIAEALLEGGSLSTEQVRSRDRFHLGFGGRPVLLPSAVILIPNAALRLAYRVATWPLPLLLALRKRGSRSAS
jgi:hypothetical protein